MINSIVPDNILAGQSVELSITGGNFISPVYVILNGNSISPTLITPNLVKIIIPSLLSGNYAIIIKNGDGNRWISSVALNVTDNTVINSMLGSVAYPIVLPQITINSSPTATQNNNVINMSYNTPATVTLNNDVNTATGVKNIDSSSQASEAYTSGTTTILSSNGAIVNTPWGSFKN